eukprot:10022862-Alexandrium_andersonii.AAC.1
MSASGAASSQGPLESASCALLPNTGAAPSTAPAWSGASSSPLSATQSCVHRGSTGSRSRS